MFLYHTFPPELIIVNLQAEDKDEVFEEMADKFCQTTGISSRENLLQALWERETKMSTGIQKGVAIPHGKVNGVKDVYGVLGISKNGIDYDALDGQPVYLVFMLLVPQTDSEEHLQILKRLSEMLHNHNFYTELMAQNNQNGVNDVIRKFEDIYIASE
jgi:PTS system fructose-specific IIC component/PTS system nitrogen regulatory IIA component